MKIACYLLIAFLWSWLAWQAGLRGLNAGINDRTLDRFAVYFYIGVYGPLISAIVTTGIFNGFSGIRMLLQKMLRWKAPLVVYLVIFSLPLVLMACGIGVYALWIGPIGPFYGRAFAAIPATLWGALFAGPLGEELGWRGFLLPELQERFSAINSSLATGVIWYCWHIPLFFAPFGTLVSGAPLTLLPLITYFAMIVCLACLCTWAVNRANRSVLIAILTHLFMNSGLVLLFFPEIRHAYRLLFLLSAPLMILFTVYLGIKTKFK